MATRQDFIGVKLNTRSLNRLLDRLERRTGDLSPAFRRADRITTKFFWKQFQTRGRYGGDHWKPLRPATLDIRERLFGIGHDKPLILSGQLRHDYTSGQVREIGSKTYARGVRGKIATIHHEGVSPDRQFVFGRRPRNPKGIPARKVIPDELPGVLISAWQTTIANYIEEG